MHLAAAFRPPPISIIARPSFSTSIAATKPAWRAVTTVSAAQWSRRVEVAALGGDHLAKFLHRFARRQMFGERFRGRFVAVAATTRNEQFRGQGHAKFAEVGWAMVGKDCQRFVDFHSVARHAAVRLIHVGQQAPSCARPFVEPTPTIDRASRAGVVTVFA